MADTELEKKLLEHMEATTETTTQADIAAQIPTTVKIGEKEYTQEQLTHLVGLGELGDEMETKWNTKIDSLFPAYSKSQNELKELKEKLETPAKVPDLSTLPQDQVGEVKNLLKSFGFVTKEDAEEISLSQSKRQRDTEKLLEEVDGFEKEIDGSDGRPAFKKVPVLEYMRDEGVKNPMTAYKLMNEESLNAWTEKTLLSSKKPGMVTTETAGGTGTRTPDEVKPTKANLDQLLKEYLETHGGN